MKKSYLRVLGQRVQVLQPPNKKDSYMLLEFSKTHGLEHAGYYNTELLYRNKSFCVVKVTRFRRPKAEHKKFREGGGKDSFAAISYHSPGYYLIKLVKPSWSIMARNPRTRRKWRYNATRVFSVELSKNWRNNVKRFITACDALGDIKL